jgi:hypothetical protein
MTFRIMYLILKFIINYGQHGDTQHNVNAYHDIQNNVLNFEIQYESWSAWRYST